MMILKVLRPHQWLKNLLLLVPLLTSRTNIDLSLLKLMLTGLLGFSLFCSANYIVNDLIDFQSDKNITYKSQKPIASGNLKKTPAIVLAIILAALGFTFCLYTSVLFLQVTVLYLCLGLIYSKYLKKIPQIDVVTLVLFYEIRIFAGGVLFKIPISFWLILFSFTIFSSLAFVKKSSKSLIESKFESEKSKSQTNQIEINYLVQFGISFAVLSIVTFALYLNSEEIKFLYAQPKILWFLIPLLQFLLLRIWKETISGRMHYDPILFILRDYLSFVCLCIMLLAISLVGKVN
jgi:4-hydroxybenzoate polyprenyltransferase